MGADVVDLAESLVVEASRTNERRLLVLAGERERGYDALESTLEALSVGITETTLVGPEDRLRCECVTQAHAGELLGRTREIVVFDAHAGLRPNALGKTVGAVDGGGLFILLTPSLERWPERRGEFDASLAVPPFSEADVTGRFRRRLVETLRTHRGIAIVDLEAHRIVDNGLTEPTPRVCDGEATVETPPDPQFPRTIYDACYTNDQADAVAAFESLLESDERRAVVLEADRGRGKSSAAGLAAAALATAGVDVLVTAPRWQHASEVFERATDGLGALEDDDQFASHGERYLETTAGGSVRYLEPADAVDRLDSADIVIVDEAAALPVSTLESLLSAERVAFATTIHGYEGAGRGFSVRFRERLGESDHDVTDCTLAEPIRYAAGDPVEVWAFRALLLDARPPAEPLVLDAAPETVDYRRLEPDELFADEQLLREVFGLLVLAHYRTEPNDLARLLDAPNLEVRALVHRDDGTGNGGDSIGDNGDSTVDAAGNGHVVSVALLAREGNLPAETRARMYEGGRVRGNMLPDVLTSQLRDEAAAEPAGLRIVRIATHHAVRSRGLGSHLLECVRSEFATAVDWLGTGFGATPGLLAFWRENGYRPIHVSTTRNEASGEYSTLLLAPTSDAGRELYERHADWFARRFPACCTDALRDVASDVARAILRSVDADAAPTLELTDHEWRVVAGAAYGPGLFDIDPGPFRPLAVRYLIETPDAIDLTAREERLLVLRVLQARAWDAVATCLEYHSTSQCMRALGEAVSPLVDHYGGEVTREVRERFEE
ncbi:tRNA(Met) cytidine acetyltransferase [Salinadaptatus halalkaliphilus]|uniref:tRNA(Met) cytidine acetyltransferase TmcA n=1 Tax=Salinadaptatus halalkaliphilus TaxID=2419781 RepID=A0A4S3THB6_9EURY|nr:tRNA(Met) cytidine acetyltransferase TmcA [Salinadaptatus halalkaliphilus]THE63359.1 tRNA(Met) cytidine acetyltransferase [Salinadaptatus halalkaliphilus]